MGQQISDCRSGNEPSKGSFQPHVGDFRKQKFLDVAPRSLPLPSNDDNTATSRATSCTGLSSSKASISPSSSSSGGTVNKIKLNTAANPIRNSHPNIVHKPVALRYTTSTRDLHEPDTNAATTTTTTTTIPPSTHVYATRGDSNSKPQQHMLHSQQGTVPLDKRSNPVKFPRKRNFFDRLWNAEQQKDTSDRHDTSPHAPQDASYLERMYDARTWDMYRRITTHRERVEALNAANAKQDNDDDRNSTNQTYMSDPVQRVTNSSTMEGGIDYDNFYDPATEDDGNSVDGGLFLLEDHSAPPYRHHRQCDNGQHHHGGFYHKHGECQNNNRNAEPYSEWESMYGDDVEVEGHPGNHSASTHGGQHETIFLFDF